MDLHASLLELVRVEAQRIARRLPRETIGLDDLVGHGHIGLVEAQQRFDPQRGVPFDLFARRRVRGAIFDALRAQGFLKRRGWEAARRQSQAHRLLDAGVGEAAGSDDAMALAMSVGLLATHLLTDEAIMDEAAPALPADALLEGEATRRRLRSAIDALATEDREVVDAVYDFEDLGDSGAELARRRGVSRSHVSRAHLRILETLRFALAEVGA